MSNDIKHCTVKYYIITLVCQCLALSGAEKVCDVNYAFPLQQPPLKSTTKVLLNITHTMSQRCTENLKPETLRAHIQQSFLS